MAHQEEILFGFKYYKEYLQTLEEKKSFVRKGFRSKLAEAVGCNSAFVSHVLNEDAHFSLEQAYKINTFLGHSEEQAKYFLLLIQYARAGTEELRNFFDKQIDLILQTRQVIKHRLKVKEKLSLEEKIRYYSSWEYAAIHVLITISTFQTSDKIAERLQITQPRVHSILGNLVKMGLVKRDHEKYLVADARIHIGSDTELIIQHHTNWRTRALTAFATTAAQDIHYSSAITISHHDAKKLNALIINFIAKINPVIDASKAEEIYSFCLDFYKL